MSSDAAFAVWVLAWFVIVATLWGMVSGFSALWKRDR
jgi:hypothetical protein